MGNRLYLVSDAMPTVGGKKGSFMINGEEILGKNDKCISKDGVIAGSNLNLLKAVKNCIDYVEIDIIEAIKMATLEPAKLIKKNTEIGKIKKGFNADLLIFNNSFEILKIVINGEIE